MLKDIQTESGSKSFNYSTKLLLKLLQSISAKITPREVTAHITPKSYCLDYSKKLLLKLLQEVTA